MPSAFICVVLVGVSLIFHSFTNSRSIIGHKGIDRCSYWIGSYIKASISNRKTERYCIVLNDSYRSDNNECC